MIDFTYIQLGQFLHTGEPNDGVRPRRKITVSGLHSIQIGLNTHHSTYLTVADTKSRTDVLLR